MHGQKKKYKQRSMKYYTKDRVTRPQLKTGGELRCSGRVGISCSTSVIRRAVSVPDEGYPRNGWATH